MSNRKKLDIQVIGYETEIIEFLKFIGAIQYLGNIGASRDLNLAVDGDGSGQLNFKVLWSGETEYKDLPSTEIDTGSSKERFNFYLGE